MASRGSERDERDEPYRDGLSEDAGGGAVEPDVLLDVPELNVEELDLEVENLQAHVSVRAELANFVNINIGVDVHLDRVKLQIKGVKAQLQLKVRLERILGTIESALSAIEQNPQLLDNSSGAATGGLPEIESPAAAPASSGPQPPASAEAGAGGEVEATRAARHKAEELGVDLSRVEGTGAGGRVLLRDVQRAAQ